MRAALRAAVALLIAALLLPLTAGIAAAHGDATGPPAADLPVVRAIEPAVAGLTVTVIESGSRLRLDNGTGTTVAVTGTEVVVPPGASAAWADPRPTAGSWVVPLLVGEQPVTVRGDRVRPPDPPPAPWWALTLAAALGTFSLGGTAALRQSRRRWAAGVAAVTLAVLTAHALHVAGAALVLAEPPSLGTLAAAAGIGPVCWALGLAGVLLVLAGRPLGLATCAAAGSVTALLTGFDTVGFHRAVLDYGWAFDLDRAATVIAFGGGVGLFLTGWAALRASPPPVPDGPHHHQRQHADDEQRRHVVEQEPAEQPDHAEHEQRRAQRPRVTRGP